MSAKKNDNLMVLFDQAFGIPLRRLGRQRHALNLAADEFWLSASLKGHSFVTTRNRADKLAHVAQRTVTVWRRTLAGPQLQRLVAQAMCGQWVMQARPTDWFRDEPRCERCIEVLRRALNEPDDDRAAVSA